MTAVRWADIEAEVPTNYREGFVAAFRKYEGQETDERDRYGRVVHVTVTSFARHFGINRGSFWYWVNEGRGFCSVTEQKSEEREAVSMDAVEGDSPRRRVDKRGRPQLVRRTTPAEIARRDEWIAKLNAKGHSGADIARALGLAESGVSLQLKKMGLSRPRMRGAGPVTEPTPWRDGEVVAVREPRWRTSRVLAMAKMLDDEYREGNFANVLAGQATDALDAGDRDWLGEAAAAFGAAIEKLERARRILTDPSYRAECRDGHEGVESLRTGAVPLRAVR